jgi:hypothetical protein
MTLTAEQRREHHRIAAGTYRRAHPERIRVKNIRWNVERPLYTTWENIRQRCTNPKTRNYKWYGGRGIEICAKWSRFQPFEAYVLENLGPKLPGFTLDRIDNDGNYEPGNIRWATSSEQYKNQRHCPTCKCGEVSYG